MLLILFFSMELTAQTKLIVFSENNDTFIANINSDRGREKQTFEYELAEVSRRLQSVMNRTGTLI